MKTKNVSDRVIRYVMTVNDKEFAALTVGTLACSFQIDRYKLLRQFKRQTDMTLEDFLNKEKMARAAFLLKTYREITVKEVSERIGFCTCDYFIRKFRAFYGLAPGRYRILKTGEKNGQVNIL
jgi:AraC-like DNA-binding protein